MTPSQQELAKEIHKNHTKLRRLTNPKKTKAQNKKYARTAYLKKQSGIISIKAELAKLPEFNSICFVCEAKSSKRGMTFHHRYYILNDVIRKNYPKGEKGTLNYYQDLAPLIKLNPTRFLFVCNPHHQSITRLTRFKPENRRRLFLAVEMSV